MSIETFTIKPGVVGFTLSGTMDKQFVEQATALFERELAAHERLAIFAEVGQLSETIKWEGLWADLMVGAKHLKDLYRIEKLALVTDDKMIRAAAHLEKLLLWQTDYRIFSVAEREKALAWISEQIASPARGLTRLPSTNPGVLAYTIEGKVTGFDLREMGEAVDAVSIAHGKVGLLVKMPGFPQIGEGVVTEKLRLLHILPKVKRYAVVGPGWLQGPIAAINPLLAMEMRFFSLEEEEQALAWVSEN